MRHVFLLFILVPTLAQAQAPKNLPQEKPDRVVQGSEGRSALIYFPGTIRKGKGRLTGHLFWRQGKRVRALGVSPADAFPTESGAYVVYKRGFKLIIAHRYLGGREEVVSQDFDYHLYKRKIQVRLTDRGAEVLDRAGSGRQLLRVGAEAETFFERRALGGAEQQVLNRYGVSLLDLARKKRFRRPFLLPERYAAFEKAVQPQGKSLCAFGPADLNARQYVERLAYRLAENQVEHLKGWELFEIRIPSLGTDGKADMAKTKLVELIGAASGKRVILFLDGIHRLLEMGGGGSDLFEDLVPAMAKKEIFVIATSGDSADSIGVLRTRSGFSATMRDHKITPLDKKKELPQLIAQKASELQSRYNLVLSERLQKRLIQQTDYHLPDVSHPTADLMVLEKMVDQLGKSHAHAYEATHRDLAKAIEALAPPVPFESRAKVDGLRNYLDERLIGQVTAKEKIVGCFRQAVIGARDTHRPVCIFLALGPSGVGKTYSANLVQQYFEVEKNEYKMESYKERHTIHSLIGSPASYVGSGKPGDLVDFMSQHPTGVLVLDEVDKAHPDVLQALNPLFDEGVMKDLSNASAHFNRGVIFMTSNFGIKQIRAFEAKHPRWRQYEPAKRRRLEADLTQKVRDKMIADGILPAWVVGRIPTQNWMVYHGFDRNENLALAKIFAKQPIKRIAEANGFEIVVDPSVYAKIVDENRSADTGARPIRDQVQGLMGEKFYQMLAKVGELYGKKILLTVENGEFLLRELK